MHTLNQGMTPHLLRSTVFAMMQWIRNQCDVLGLEASEFFQKKAVQRMTDNMRQLREVRDHTGIHFTNLLLKLPETLLSEVTRESSGKMSKLKAFEYQQVAQVRLLMQRMSHDVHVCDFCLDIL